MNKGKTMHLILSLPGKGTKRPAARGLAVALAASITLFPFLTGCGSPGQENTDKASIPESAEQEAPAAAPSADVTPAAEGSKEDPSAALPDTGAQDPSTLQVTGTVEEITDGQITLAEEGESAAGSFGISLNISEATVLLDAVTLETRTLSHIRERDLIHAVISPNMTRSIPPISNAYVIFLGVSENAALPTYARITEIASDDSGNPLLVTDQELILILGEDTLIRSYDGARQLSASELKAGDCILASYQLVTMSIPAQANPDAILLMPETDGP